MPQMSVYFDKKTDKRLEKKAKNYGLTKYAVITQLIDAFLENPANFKPCYHVKITEVQSNT